MGMIFYVANIVEKVENQNRELQNVFDKKRQQRAISSGAAVSVKKGCLCFIL